VTLTVTVTDPTGGRWPGQGDLHLAVPGVPAIASSQLTTGSNGRRRSPRRSPAATKGQASATVIVDTDSLGHTTDRTVITIS
jgi:hypothetical protein